MLPVLDVLWVRSCKGYHRVCILHHITLMLCDIPIFPHMLYFIYVCHLFRHYFIDYVEGYVQYIFHVFGHVFIHL